jgi:hypothetical protein
VREGTAEPERPLVLAYHGNAALRCELRHARMTSRPKRSPVDSSAIDYIIGSEAVPQNEPPEGGVPVMLASIIVSATFFGSVAVPQRH